VQTPFKFSQLRQSWNSERNMGWRGDGRPVKDQFKDAMSTGPTGGGAAFTSGAAGAGGASASGCGC
jgi:hypothetical protein